MKRQTRLLTLLTGATLAGSAALLAPATAAACGGFFCNRSAPVEQTGEHIIFAVDEEAGKTEATVLVNYAGPSESFAWIVPTPSFPEIGVSSASVFNTIESLIGPRFYLNWSTRGTCDYGMWAGEGDFGAPSASADAGAGGGRDEDGGVTVIARQNVGPYDTVILQATDSEVLLEWLQENGYDIPDTILPYVDPYVQMGGTVHFAAFKLLSDRDTGDLQPIVLRYDGVKPTIPIQLTAVATQPDLGVTATVLGSHRAVPENYLSVEINLARLNWLSSGSNYEELIRAAMDEAGGQGFRTEFAGSTALFDGMFYQEGRFNREAIADASVFNIVGVLQSQGFMGDPQILRLFEEFIPVPEGLDAQSFYNCIECYSDRVSDELFDSEAFADALWTTIVEPLEHAQETFDALPYVTRLHTALSAEEMTLDPIFAFNPDMSDFSNVQTADAIVDCGDGGDYYASPIIIRLADGREIVTGWDVPRGELDAMPAADSFAETGASGAPVVVRDNRESIGVVLADYNEAVGRSFLAPRDQRDAGCTAAGGAGAGSLALGLIGLFALRRRRSA
ncbi:MAG: DUF2330 domain-containing protein [Myxococcales bacterium]|nr:DUF2330 domain-containing protein [Myxococcales bacterium]MCB9520538.1 DUF2330 domain-containing protein [Myxococcales bacterium]